MKAELHNLRCWVGISHPEKLRTLGKSLLELADFEVLGFMEHHFSPQGYTCIWLLGESHLAIHSYPEHDKSYVELTSCVQEKREVFLTELKEKHGVVSSVADCLS